MHEKSDQIRETFYTICEWANELHSRVNRIRKQREDIREQIFTIRYREAPIREPYNELRKQFAQLRQQPDHLRKPRDQVCYLLKISAQKGRGITSSILQFSMQTY